MKPKLSKNDETVRLTIKLPERLRDELFAACINNDQTVSQVMRAMVRDYIKKHGKKQ